MAKIESKENLLGKYKDGKMFYVTPSYNFMKRTKRHPHGGGGIVRTQSVIHEFEITNKDVINELINEKWYRFDVINGKANVKLKNKIQV